MIGIKLTICSLFIFVSAAAGEVLFQDDFDTTVLLDQTKWTTYWIDAGDSIAHAGTDPHNAGKYCRMKCGNTHIQLRSKASGDYTDLTIRFWSRVSGNSVDVIGSTFAPCDSVGKTPLALKAYCKGDGTYRAVLASGNDEEVLYDSLVLGTWEKWELRVLVSNGGNNVNCWLWRNGVLLKNNAPYPPMAGMTTAKLNQFIAWGANKEFSVDDVHIINNTTGLEIFADNFDSGTIGSVPNPAAWSLAWMDPEDEITIQQDSAQLVNNYAEVICADSSVQLRSTSTNAGSQNVVLEFKANVVDGISSSLNKNAAISLIDNSAQFPLVLYFKANGNNTYDVQVGSGSPMQRQTIVANVGCNQWVKWQLAIDMNSTGNDGIYTLIKDDVIVKAMESFRSFAPPGGGLLTQVMFTGDCRNWLIDDVSLDNDTSEINRIHQPEEVIAADYTLQLTSDGGIQINIGEDSYKVYSMLPSYYNAKWLGDGVADNWASFSVSSLGNTQTINIRDINYNLTRTITAFPKYIQVKDTFTNPNTMRIGLAFTNEIRKSNADTVHSYVDGMINAVPYTGNRSEMPYVQVAGNADSLGMIAVDDIYRNQIRTYGQIGGTYGLADDYLALAGSKSCSIEWQLYPVKGKSHYSFINQVREIWQNNNLTIKGLYAFLYSNRKYAGKTIDQMSTAETTSWLANLNAKYLMYVFTSEIDPRPEYPIEAFGDEYLSAVSAKRWWRPSIDRIRSLRPDIKMFPYFHAGLNVLRSDLASSALLDENGAHKSFTNYMGHTRHYYCPLGTNGFGTLITQVLKAMIAEFGTDGIYWDEFTFGYRPLYMNGFPQWDGFTALQTPTGNGRSTQQRTTAELIWKDKRQALVNLIDESGGELVVNFQPITKDIIDYMRTHNAPAFVECTQKSARYSSAPRGHLFSPLLLCGFDINNNAGLMQEYCEALKYGTLPALIYEGAYSATVPNPAGYFFPITITNIYSGVIVGREKIVTAKSGVFGFNNTTVPTVRIFDTSAVQIAYAPQVVEQGGNKYVKIDLKQGQIAVIVNSAWNFNSEADLNFDGTVNFLDVTIFSENWL